MKIRYKKYTSFETIYQLENKDDYKEKIESAILSNEIKNNWIRNIIDNKSDIEEKIYYNDDEFVIIPNYKWDMESIDKLYLILIF